ncbi:hypothetical protein B0H11DRAFT_1747270 [Mycena galericulata]|nr:hypothetical protein B0H11DRAFT_1747270 [Mycena galericulata]
MSWDVLHRLIFWPLVAFLVFLKLPNFWLSPPRTSAGPHPGPRPRQILEPNSTRQPPSHYSPSSPQDVFKVRHLFLRFLPPELVNTILDDAEYWPRILAARDTSMTLTAASSPEHNAARSYLVTPPFPSIRELGGPGARLRVKRVEFYILSGDQGWSSTPQYHGTYDGSYTWFEAAIMRPGEPPALRGWRRWALTMGLIKFRRPWIEVKNSAEDGGRWRIQTNRCAHKKLLPHTIVWAVDSTEPDLKERNGSGDGAGFIDMLAPGDCISIIARAMFPGWVNRVRSAEIVVYYAV